MKSFLAKLLPYRKSVPSFDELSLKVKTHESQKDNNGWRKNYEKGNKNAVGINAV